jgi:hypothetical protein
MPRNQIARIRQAIRFRQYDMSAHATEEMAEDGLDIVDVESVILHGEIIRMERDDPRGTKYVIEGVAAGQFVPVRVVGRYTSSGRYLIITVYAVSESEG